MASSDYPEMALNAIFKRARTGADYDLPSLQFIQSRLRGKLGCERTTLLESDSLPGKPEIPERLLRSNQTTTKEAKQPKAEEEAEEKEGNETAETKTPAKRQREKDPLSMRQSLLGRMKLLAALGPSVNDGKDDVMLLSAVFAAEMQNFGLGALVKQATKASTKQASAVSKHNIERSDRLLRAITLAAHRSLRQPGLKKASAESRGAHVLPPNKDVTYISACLEYYVARLKADPEAAAAIMAGGPEPVRTLSQYIEAVAPSKSAEVTAQVEEWLKV